jgi:hypothetical protein
MTEQNDKTTYNVGSRAKEPITLEWMKKFFDKVYKSTRASVIQLTVAECFKYERPVGNETEVAEFHYQSEIRIDNAGYEEVYNLIKNHNWSVFDLTLGSRYKLIGLTLSSGIGDVGLDKLYSSKETYDMTTDARLNPYTATGRSYIEENLKMLEDRRIKSVKNFPNPPDVGILCIAKLTLPTDSDSTIRISLENHPVNDSNDDSNDVMLYVSTTVDFPTEWTPNQVKTGSVGVLEDRMSRYGEISINKESVNYLPD